MPRNRLLLARTMPAFITPQLPRCVLRRAPLRLVCHASRKPAWRPSLDDVSRISRGSAARVRGTGSRAVPHRLNADERAHYVRAQEKGFLHMPPNRFHRRERRGSPLQNTWRMWCDAQGRPAVAVVADDEGAACLAVDLSTMRGERYHEFGSGLAAVVAALDDVVGVHGVLQGGEHGFGEELLQGPTWMLPTLELTYEFSERARAKMAARDVAEFCVDKLKGAKLAAKARPKGVSKGRSRADLLRRRLGEEEELRLI